MEENRQSTAISCEKTSVAALKIHNTGIGHWSSFTGQRYHLHKEGPYHPQPQMLYLHHSGDGRHLSVSCVACEFVILHLYFKGLLVCFQALQSISKAIITKCDTNPDFNRQMSHIFLLLWKSRLFYQFKNRLALVMNILPANE